jgi:hypothetical protein
MTSTEKNKRLQDLRRELSFLRKKITEVEDNITKITKQRTDEKLVEYYFGSEYESGICYD